LLEHGATVDAVTSIRTGQNALWLAAVAGYSKDVESLLRHGASPEHPNREHSPMAIARKGHYKKCIFLLEKVKDHGKEYLERLDLWHLYENEQD
jgi:hypothetical protein